MQHQAAGRQQGGESRTSEAVEARQVLQALRRQQKQTITSNIRRQGGESRTSEAVEASEVLKALRRQQLSKARGEQRAEVRHEQLRLDAREQRRQRGRFQKVAAEGALLGEARLTVPQHVRRRGRRHELEALLPVERGGGREEGGEEGAGIKA